MDTSTGINGKDDLQRQLRLALKNSDLLRMVVFRKQELVLGEASDRSSLVIGHVDKDINQPAIDTDGRWLCACLRVGNEAKGAAECCAKCLHFCTRLGGKGSPSAQTAPSSKCSFFQMGTVFLSVSISQRQASNAWALCAEDTAIRTLVSPTSSRPRRCTIATWRTPCRPIASSASAFIWRRAISGYAS